MAQYPTTTLPAPKRRPAPAAGGAKVPSTATGLPQPASIPAATGGGSLMPRPRAPLTVGAMRPATAAPAAPAPTAAPVTAPKTTGPGQVDLGQLYSALGLQAPQQQFTPQQLQGAIAAGSNAGMSQLQGGAFNLNDLLGLISRAQGAGGAAPTVGTARFQTPDQLSALTQQASQILAPQVQAQTQAATTAYNQAESNLARQFAARGLLASGAAAGAQTQGANQLAQTVAGIQGDAAQNALNAAMQYGNLGLQEQGQLFGEQQANQQNAQQQAQNAVQNYLGGLGQQAQQQQFAAGLAQSNAQNTASNLLSALGLQQQGTQNYLGNLMSALGLSQQQAQFGANLGEQGREFDASQLANLASIFGVMPGAGGASLGGLSGAYGALSGAPTLAATENAQQVALQQQAAQLAQQQFGETQKQNNIGNALSLSQLFGTPVNPASTGAGLFGQVAGQQTLAQQQQTLAGLQALADITGKIPAGMAGAGGNTLAATQALAQLALSRQQLGLQQAQLGYDYADLNQRQNQDAISNILSTASGGGQMTPAQAQALSSMLGVQVTPGTFGGTPATPLSALNALTTQADEYIYSGQPVPQALQDQLGSLTSQVLGQVTPPTTAPTSAATPDAGVQSQITAARKAGASDAQIAATLQAENLDPSVYGLKVAATTTPVATTPKPVAPATPPRQVFSNGDAQEFAKLWQNYQNWVKQHP